MESSLQVRYSHQLLGHFPVDDVDTDFYSTLTGVEETYVATATGLPDKPIPSVDQVITVVGTTVLTSESIAAIVKAWLEKRSTTITISDPQARRKIELKGPKLEASIESIKEMIDALVAAEDTSHIGIRAIHT